jgi:D-tyrosyl-tRNA(Tyr) deacylase
MRVVLQRVSRAAVTVDGQTVGAIGRGLLALVGIEPADDGRVVALMAEKIRHLRIFGDASGKMNRDVAAAGGAVLVVSQFTLAADASKGRRPSFSGAARSEIAEPLVAELCAALSGLGLEVACGVFGAPMEVELVNDGPVTLLLEL